MDRERRRGRSCRRRVSPAVRGSSRAGAAAALILLILVTARFVAVPAFWAYSGLSRHYRVTEGQSTRLALRAPGLFVSEQVPAAARGRGLEPVVAVSLLESTRGRPLLSLTGIAPGTASLTVRALGGLLVRSVRIDVLPEVRVIPGGQAIGVMLAPSGVIVVGLAPVKGADGRVYYPARDAGLFVGDCIERVAGIEVDDAHHVEHLIELAARRNGTVTLDIRRDGSLIRRRIVPVKTEQGGGPAGLAPGTGAGSGARFKVGLYVRDNSAGVGTLSFVLPGSDVYGALGHIVPDLVRPRQGKAAQPQRPRVAPESPESGGPGAGGGGAQDKDAGGAQDKDGGASGQGGLDDGRIVRAYIAGVEQGSRGRPGEKIGMFEGLTDILGSIDANTPLGIFGRLSRPLPPELAGVEPVPVGLVEDTRLGAAEMLTVVSDTEVERFEVQIVRATRQARPGQRGLVIKVTDPRLASSTGGIVQGMSGSPILQDGKLVGVVTHVLVSDPLRGYATHAEWMVREALRVAEQSVERSEAGG